MVSNPFSFSPQQRKGPHCHSQSRRNDSCKGKGVSSAIRSKQENKIYDYYGAADVIDEVDDYIFDERLLLIGEDGANLLSRSKDNAFFAEGKYESVK